MANEGQQLQGGALPYAFPLPAQLNVSDKRSWPSWLDHFERYRIASGLSGRDEFTQVNTLMFCMGPGGEDILRAARLTDEEKNSYKSVKEVFQRYFVGKRNIIYDRACFNKRAQEKGETID